jgi:hypothetical protein
MHPYLPNNAPKKHTGHNAVRTQIGRFRVSRAHQPGHRAGWAAVPLVVAVFDSDECWRRVADPHLPCGLLPVCQSG